jgi:hypothetical protein
MSPRASSSRESGTVLTWEYEPARSLLDPGELQLELQLQLMHAGRADALQHAAAPTRRSRTNPDRRQAIPARNGIGRGDLRTSRASAIGPDPPAWRNRSSHSTGRRTGGQPARHRESGIWHLHAIQRISVHDHSPAGDLWSASHLCSASLAAAARVIIHWPLLVASMTSSRAPALALQPSSSQHTG